MGIKIGDRLEYKHSLSGQHHVMEVTFVHSDGFIDAETISTEGYPSETVGKKYVRITTTGYGYTNKACYLNLPSINLNYIDSFEKALDKLEKYYEKV